MAIIGGELEDYVIKQINARQTLHGSGVGHTGTLRTDKQINLLNSNTSWIKLASGVSISGSNRLTELNLSPDLTGMGLAKNNILFSGTSKIIDGKLEQREGFLPRDDNSSYTYGSFGFSPMPGIESADIKTLTRGSLKKATVKLTANNKQQFDIIDLLYMRLGYTVLLEWGNSIYTTNGTDKNILRNTLIEDMFFNTESNGSYIEMLEPIKDKRIEYKGNYDALLGKVSNFNWSFNPDGSYSIELTIISLGDVIESLKSNLSIDSKTQKFFNDLTTTTTSDSATADSSEDTIDEEETQTDIITAMLAIYKFVNNNIKTETRPLNITTSQVEDIRYKFVGRFLDTSQESVNKATLQIPTITYEYTVTYRTEKERENEKFNSANTINTTTYTPSDIRLKTNIKLIDTIKGLNIYLYNYLWDLETIYKGVMAQELLNTEYSNAVAIHDTGYYVVDYSKLPISLKIGDKLVTENGLIEITNIKSKEMNNTQIPLYNFHVSNDNSYIANNYIVHNKQ
jgi:hypothetical protein